METRTKSPYLLLRTSNPGIYRRTRILRMGNHAFMTRACRRRDTERIRNTEAEQSRKGGQALADIAALNKSRMPVVELGVALMPPDNFRTE